MDIGSTTRTDDRIALRFEGSGSQYFRIWFVNILMSLLTLSFYLPFAKARKLTYFYSNTWVGNQSFGYHGNPWKLLQGHVLLVGVLIVLATLRTFWPTGGPIVLLALLPALPWLWWSAVRARAANTTLGPAALQFTGTIREVYQLFMPASAAGAVWLATYAALIYFGIDPETRPEGAEQQAQSGFEFFGPLVLSIATLVFGYLLTRLRWNLTSYRHSHYRIGNETFKLDVPYKQYEKILTRSVGVGLLAAIGVGAACFALVAALSKESVESGLGFLPLLCMLALVTASRTFSTARIQDLVWSNCTSEHVCFKSNLTFKRWLWTQTRAGALTVITLGLYWPFAAVMCARERVQAIHVQTTLPVEGIVAESAKVNDKTGASSAGFGEAAMEANPLGLEVGL